MSWNTNDLEHLTLIDRVKRLERSTLKPNEDGGYDETSPNITERVEALEAKVFVPTTRNVAEEGYPENPSLLQTFVDVSDNKLYIFMGSSWMYFSLNSV